MKKIVFATSNPTKAQRFSVGLLTKEIEVLTLKAFGIILDVEENGSSATENALLKARECYQKLKMPTIAMDDTLYLEGVPAEIQPGLFVRRVNGKRLTDKEMLDYYTNLVKKYGTDGKIEAKWIYGLAVINEGQEYTYSWSKNNFLLVDTPSSQINPGYPLNSISVNKQLNKYFTDLTAEDQALIVENENHVVDFIAEKVK